MKKRRPELLMAPEAARLRTSPGAALALDLTAAASRSFERPDVRVYRLADGRILVDGSFPILFESDDGLMPLLSRDPRAHWARPWPDRRGYDIGDSNIYEILVRAPIDEVVALLTPLARGCVVDALDRDVPAAATAIVVFQLEGHGWTIVLNPGATPGDALLEGSRTRGWKLLELSVSDTMGTVHYELVEGGAVIEQLASEGERVKTFTSSRRGPLDEDERTHPLDVLRELVTTLDLYVPDFGLRTFIPLAETRAKTWRLETPRFEWEGNPPLMTTPPFAGVAYVWFEDVG